jgi:hypothetical protein
VAAARITKSLDKLRGQVNAFAPKRSKASDGWIGDSKHSMRKSDHNPEPDGTVDALDITHDPKNGVDIQKLCDAIIASRDKRVSYLICNGKIISGNGGPQPWVKRKYNGANKHTQHLHVSVLDKHQDDTTDWDIAAAFSGAPKPKPVSKPAPKPAPRPADSLHSGKVNEELRTIQKTLAELGYHEVGTADGRWGGRTETAVMAFRNDNGLPTVPKVDDAFRAALLKAEPRKVAPERATATAADLRAKGSDTIKAADALKTGATVVGVGGVALGGAEAVEQADPIGNKLGILKQVVDIIDPVKDFIASNAWWVIPIVAVAGFWYAQKIVRTRVEDHRTGRNLGL